MASSRTATLIVQSAVRGLIDYREARLDDPQWWKRWQILVEGMEAENNRTIRQYILDMRLAQLAAMGMSPDGYEKKNREAVNLVQDLIASIRPWEGGYIEKKRREVDDYRQQYIEMFGDDPLDPEFKKREADAVRKLLELPDELPPETDDEALSRRLRERRRA